MVRACGLRLTQQTVTQGRSGPDSTVVEYKGLNPRRAVRQAFGQVDPRTGAIDCIGDDEDEAVVLFAYRCHIARCDVVQK